MFGFARIPRMTMTVGYDPRFSDGNFGVWVGADPDRADEVDEAAAEARSRGGAP